MIRVPSAVMCLGFGLSVALAQTPSFDCGKAQTADEKAICADPELAELDRLTAQAFAEARRTGGRSKAVAVARASLDRRRRCDAERTCILAEQLKVLELYRELGAKIAVPAWAEAAAPDAEEARQQESSATPAASGEEEAQQGERPAISPGPLPSKVGQCTNTAIVLIADRFGSPVNADPQGGTAIWFANSGYQVSSGKVAAIIKSVIGDPVQMCLVELPKNCPPGDERGKVYETKNLRTGEAWSLPDAQPACGGT